MLVVRQQGNRLSISGLLESASMQKICYDRGRKLKELYGFVWSCPHTTPGQAFTHGAGTPDIHQYTGWVLGKSASIS